MTARRGRDDLEGHAFEGWVLAEELSDEARAKAGRAHEGLRGLTDLTVRHGLEEILAELEGDLIPTCTCGWRGYSEPWAAPSLRSRRGGQQFISHEFTVRSTAATERLAAEVAAAALRHAVDDWDGDESVAEWLEARAEHIEAVGRYDAETWPSTAG
ncbi:hypothetical protein GCM10027416_11010 [Okibacterium endophyticum]